MGSVCQISWQPKRQFDSGGAEPQIDSRATEPMATEPVLGETEPILIPFIICVDTFK